MNDSGTARDGDYRELTAPEWTGLLRESSHGLFITDESTDDVWLFWWDENDWLQHRGPAAETQATGTTHLKSLLDRDGTRTRLVKEVDHAE